MWLKSVFIVDSLAYHNSETGQSNSFKKHSQKWSFNWNIAIYITTVLTNITGALISLCSQQQTNFTWFDDQSHAHSMQPLSTQPLTLLGNVDASFSFLWSSSRPLTLAKANHEWWVLECLSVRPCWGCMWAGHRGPRILPWTASSWLGWNCYLS